MTIYTIPGGWCAEMLHMGIHYVATATSRADAAWALNQQVNQDQDMAYHLEQAA